MGASLRWHDDKSMDLNKCFYVYIMASKHYGTLYIGMTSDLAQRNSEHKLDLREGFTKKYGVHRLVYYEMHETFETAMVREKQMKAWKRDWKVNLIERDNPHWDDLGKNFGS